MIYIDGFLQKDYHMRGITHTNDSRTHPGNRFPVSFTFIKNQKRKYLSQNVTFSQLTHKASEMLYQSKDLTEEEIFFVRKHLDSSIEVIIASL